MQYNSNCQKKSTLPDKHPTSRLFRSSLSWRIRCTDDFLDGLGGDAKGTALKYRYIQVNDGMRQSSLVFDIDRGGAQRLPAAYAWEEAGLPPPSWTTINRQNGHAHLGWLLETPVFDWYGRNPKPARYAEMIRRAMTAMMDADRGYVGMLTKNPYHQDWETVWGPPTRWSLEQLMEYIPAAALERPRTKHKLLCDPGIGRNVGTFDFLRFLAYGQVARYKRAGKSLRSFSAYLRRRADEHNLLYPAPLPESEIKATTKSVANWTWDRFSPHWLSKLQRRRGRLSGRRRRERTAARDQDIVAARSTGKSVQSSVFHTPRPCESAGASRVVHEPYQIKQPYKLVGGQQGRMDPDTYISGLENMWTHSPGTARATDHGCRWNNPALVEAGIPPDPGMPAGQGACSAVGIVPAVAADRPPDRYFEPVPCSHAHGMTFNRVEPRVRGKPGSGVMRPLSTSRCICNRSASSSARISS